MKQSLERLANREIEGSTTKPFDVIPETYALPEELSKCTAAVQASHGSLWIVSRDGCREGVESTCPEDLPRNENVVVSRYIANPLLLDGFKFDLRLYVLVKSFQPLEAYFYKEGFARLASVPFTKDKKRMNDRFIHLTNVAIQSKNPRSLLK
mmetsp:Transcript_26391/g.63662  ORF Transcript_26391/g.63662 Transcript_26391/m.63662 type:complete len:152 (-) Transcript_26391:748-1203(-)